MWSIADVVGVVDDVVLTEHIAALTASLNERRPEE